MSRWISTVEKILTNPNVPDHFIFNMGETWVATLGTHEKVIVNRFSLKDNYAVSVKNNINEHYTLTLCQSASGRFIRPLLIILLKKVPEELKIYSETFHLVANPSGWMTCDVFNIWVNEVFLSEVDTLRHYSNAPQCESYVDC